MSRAGLCDVAFGGPFGRELPRIERRQVPALLTCFRTITSALPGMKVAPMRWGSQPQIGVWWLQIWRMAVKAFASL